MIFFLNFLFKKDRHLKKSKKSKKKLNIYLINISVGNGILNIYPFNETFFHLMKLILVIC